jgi:hypothetical protein
MVAVRSSHDEPAFGGRPGCCQPTPSPSVRGGGGDLRPRRRPERPMVARDRPSAVGMFTDASPALAATPDGAGAIEEPGRAHLPSTPARGSRGLHDRGERSPPCRRGRTPRRPQDVMRKRDRERRQERRRGRVASGSRAGSTSGELLVPWSHEPGHHEQDDPQGDRHRYSQAWPLELHLVGVARAVDRWFAPSPAHPPHVLQDRDGDERSDREPPEVLANTPRPYLLRHEAPGVGLEPTTYGLTVRRSAG